MTRTHKNTHRYSPASTGRRISIHEYLLLLKQHCTEPNENYFVSYSNCFVFRNYCGKVFVFFVFLHKITVVILALPRCLYSTYYTNTDMENTVQVFYFSLHSPTPQPCRDYTSNIHYNGCDSSPARSILKKRKEKSITDKKTLYSLDRHWSNGSAYIFGRYT